MRIAVPFFGGFLGALGVAFVGYLLGVIGIPHLMGLAASTPTQQSLQNISWGGAMWGFIPAVFLIARRGNIYAVTVLTTIIAVTYGMLVLQGLPFAVSIQTVYRYLVNMTYAIILSATIKASGLTK